MGGRLVINLRKLSDYLWILEIDFMKQATEELN